MELRSALLAGFALLGLAGPHAVAAADDYPQRQIRLIVPFPAGAGPDQVARLLGQRLQEAFGQTVVIENRAGALGSIGAQEVARAAPDGYTLLMGTNTTQASNVAMLKNLPYAHPERMGTIYARTTGSQSSDERRNVDGEQWELLRDNVPSLISAVSATGTSGVNLLADSQVQYLHAGRISAHYFDVLAIHPIIGRNFSDTEDALHGPKTAILSSNASPAKKPEILASAI